MIEDNRPMCIYIPDDWGNRLFCETVLTEDLMDEDFPAGKIVESCAITWTKYVDKDDNEVDQWEPGVRVLSVRCMEPADFYLSVKNGVADTRTFCSYHHPKLVGM